MRGRGGPITAAVDGSGGLISAGDHRRRDTSALCACVSDRPCRCAVSRVEVLWTKNCDPSPPSLC